MNTQEALNGIYNMLAAIMAQQTNNKPEKKPEKSSATDQTITSLLKGIIETNSAKELKSTGEALEALSKGVQSFDDTARTILKEVTTSLLTLNNTLAILSNKNKLLNNVDNLIKVFNKLGTIKVEDAKNFTSFIENLTVKNPKEIQENAISISASIKMLNLIMDIDMVKLIKNLKILHKNKNIAKSIGEFIKLLHESVTSKKTRELSVKTAQAIGILLDGISKFADTGLWKLYRTYNKITGKIVGKQIVKFLDAIFNVVNKKIKASDKQIKAIGDILLSIAKAGGKDFNIKNIKKAYNEKNGKEIGKFFSSLLKQLEKLDQKKVKASSQAISTILEHLTKISIAKVFAIKLMSMMLTPKVGSQLASFFENFFKIKVTKSQADNATKIINAFVKITYAMLISVSVLALLITLLPITSLLLAVGTLYVLLQLAKSTIKGLANIPHKKANDATNITKTITVLFLSLTLSLAVLILVSKMAGPNDILIGIGMLVLVVVLGVAIVFALSKIKAKNIIKAETTILAISVLFIAVSLSMTIITATVKKNDPEDVLLGFGLIIGLVGFSVLMVYMLALMPAKKLANSLIALLAITAVITVLSIVMNTLIIPIGKKAGQVFLGTAIILGTIFGMIYLMGKLSKNNKKLYDGLITLAGIILVYTALALIIQHVVVPVGAQFKESVLGTAVILGVIGAFIFGIKLLSKITKAKLKNAVLTMAAIVVVLAVTAFVTKEFLIPVGESWGKALAGAGIVLAILGVFGTIVYFLANNKKFQQSKIKKGLAVLAELSLVIGLLGICMTPIIALSLVAGKNPGQTFAGLGAIATVIGLVSIILIVLSKVDLVTVTMGGLVLGALSLVIGLLGVCLTPLIAVALLAGKKPAQTFLGLGTITLILTLVGGIVIGLGAVGTYVLPFAAMGALIMAALTAAIGLIYVIVRTVISLTKLVKPYSIKQFAETSLKIGEILLCISAIMLAVTPMALLVPMAPFIIGILTAMNPVLWAINGIAKQIIKLVKTIRKNDVVKFRDIVIGSKEDPSNSLLGAMNDIVKKFADFGIFSIIKANIIAKALNPILNTLAKFVDIVKNVATLSFVSGYDNNGKPIYEKLPPTVFKDAAMAVSTGFGTFIDTISKSFEDFSWKAILAIKFIGNSLNPIMNVVAKFVDIVSKVATLQIVTGYDKNGKPIYEKVPDTVFYDAAIKISSGFGTFLTKLGTDMKEFFRTISPYAVEMIGKTMKPVMDVVATFVDTVIKVATLQIITGYDERDKPIYEKVDPAIFEKAGGAVSDSFGKFISTLNENFKGMNHSVKKAINSIKDSIGPVMDAVAKFTDAVVKLSTLQVADEWNDNGTPIHFKQLQDSDFTSAGTAISDSFGKFINTLSESFRKYDDDMEDALDAIAETIGPVMEAVGKWTDSILKLSTGIVSYEETDASGKTIKKVLKLTDQDYIKAADTITTTFNTFITKLTNALTKDVREKAEKAKKAIQESINPIMDSVLKFSDALKPFLSLKDDNAKGSDQYLIYRKGFAQSIATNIAEAFINFISTLSDNFTKPENEEKYTALNSVIPIIDSTLATLKKSATNIKSVISSFTDDNNNVISGVAVAKTFNSTIEEFANINTEIDYATLSDIYERDINPWLLQVKSAASYLNNIVSNINSSENSVSTVKGFNTIIELMANTTVSTYNKIKDLDYIQIRSMTDAYRHIAQNFTLISDYMANHKDLTSGIDIFISNIDKLTNKEINANLVATGGNIKVYVDRLVSFTKQIGVTTKSVKIYITTLDKAKEALQALDRQIINNERARNNALQSFADKVNNIADAVTNLKDSFEALNENKILSQFENVRNMLNTINSDIDDNNTSTTPQPSSTGNIPTKSTSGTGNIKPNNEKTTANNTVVQPTPIFGNNIKVEFYIDGRVLSGFMNINRS